MVRKPSSDDETASSWEALSPFLLRPAGPLSPPVGRTRKGAAGPGERQRSKLYQHSKNKDQRKKERKTKIMASGPITSWLIDGETMETVTDFIFLGSKLTADGDCCHEIKRCLLLGRKAMTNLHSVLKSRDITIPTKVHLVKALVFPVVMYGCESWTIKKN